MSDLRYSLLWSLFGFSVALILFVFNFTQAPASFPAYEYLAAPAIFSLQFVSEETPFWPKLVIFLIGQALIYFIVIYLIRKLIKLTQKLIPSYKSKKD